MELTQTTDRKDTVEPVSDRLHLYTDPLDHHPMTDQAHVAGKVVQINTDISPTLSQFNVWITRKGEVQTQVFNWTPIHGQLWDLVLLFCCRKCPVTMLSSVRWYNYFPKKKLNYLVNYFIIKLLRHTNCCLMYWTLPYSYQKS